MDHGCTLNGCSGLEQFFTYSELYSNLYTTTTANLFNKIMIFCVFLRFVHSITNDVLYQLSYSGILLGGGIQRQAGLRKPNLRMGGALG
jgi:hypothetical protein